MATIFIKNLPQDDGLDREAMLQLRGGTSFASRFIPGEPLRVFIPSDPIRAFIPGDPIQPTATNLGVYSL
jgi:hypothetical protein